jgi:DNA helicase-2/ATP-dependent DNA helicase PcrA
MSPLVLDAGGLYLREVLETEFTDEQLAVATAPLEPRLVIAGAGSGKTTVMAARVVHAVAYHDIAPGAVLGLTFTNKAAGELREKVRRALESLYGSDLIGDDLVDDQPTVQTYHAYAAALVRDHALRIGREPDTSLLAEAGRWQLAMSVVHRATGPFTYLKWQPRTVALYLLDLDAEMAEHNASPADVRAADAGIIAEVEALPKPTKEQTEIAQSARARNELLTLVEEYRKRKADLDLLDFGDQVALAAAIAAHAPDVGAIERTRYRVVFLDEYQDTSVAQRRLLSSLYGEGGHPVTAVGDPCQAIYGWRGASVGNLLRFPEHFPRVGEQTSYDADYLLTSFRNDGRILQAANVLSTPLRVRDPQSRRPHVEVPELQPVESRRAEGVVKASFHLSLLDEASWVADEIGQQITGEVRNRNVAVLCRRRQDFPVFRDALERRGVPVEVVGLGGLLEMPEVDDVVSVLEVLADPTANPALVRILTGPRYRIGPRDLAALGRQAWWLTEGGTGRDSIDPEDDPAGTRALAAAAAGVDPCDVVALTDAVAHPGRPEDYSPEASERLGKLRAELDTLRPLIRQPVVEAVTSIVRAIGLDVELEADPDGLGEARLANLAAFLDAAAQFEGIADDNDVHAFLDYLAAAREREDGLDVGGVSNRDTVKLLTVHKAKGLEWKVVAVPCLTDDTFPSGQTRPRWTRAARALPNRLRGDRDDLPADPALTKQGLDAFKDACSQDELTEERRLAYVAVTRARNVVLASGHAWNRTRTTDCPPGVFLEEIRDVADVGEWCVDAGDGNPIHAELEPDHEWPTAYDETAHAGRRAAAASMRAALDNPSDGPAHPLAAEVDALLDEIAREQANERVVPMPRMLSASQLLRLARDPDDFARSLARPMPQRPNAAARKGTLFHAWLEETLKSRPLLDLDGLEGAADDVDAVPTDEDLAALRTAFAASPYADRDPVAVEAPFTVQLGGRIVRGRIDAVFADGDGGYEVVDWKTGESGDPLQLAIYRIAWADLAGVDVDRVRAAFLHVRTGRVERADDLPDRDALNTLIVGPSARPSGFVTAG